LIDCGYIGTLGDGTTPNLIRKYVENQRNQEEKESSKQMKKFEFELVLLYRAWQENILLFAAGCATKKLNFL
jgi:hypothetical protein